MVAVFIISLILAAMLSINILFHSQAFEQLETDQAIPWRRKMIKFNAVLLFLIGLAILSACYVAWESKGCGCP
jgi:ABC-type lipoprotein release transport system permease subunit